MFGFLAKFSKKSRTREPYVRPVMADEDREIIYRLANGDETVRQQAVMIYRRYVPIIGTRGTPEQNYMAEVTHVCPDFLLKEAYRLVLLRNRDSDA